MISMLWGNFHYFVAILLFLIGFHTMLTHPNLIKKVIGMNIMETSVFLLFISIGYVHGGNAPLLSEGTTLYVNPLPSALILTGIVVGVSLTAFALAMIVKIYEYYGTVNTDEIMHMRDGDE